MRDTYTGLKSQFLRNINLVGSTDSNLLADFQANLGRRYQLILSELKNYKNQTQFTASTVANQQFYAWPPSTVDIESVVITVGSVNYPMQIINSQYNWDQLNAILIQASAMPQFVFPRKDDFGVWPIPQAVYTITFNAHARDRNLLVEDYVGGTVQVTSGSNSIVGTNTTWTAGMVGRWFEVTDTTVNGHGYFYRITAVGSTTTATLNTSFYGDSKSGLTYLIGESPEIPEEGGIVLVDGVTADYYSGMKVDPDKSAFFTNKFLTGEGSKGLPEDMTAQSTIKGGLYGLINRYKNRTTKTIIRRKPKLNPLQYKVWSTNLS
jgi:hypothetical protein